MAQFQQGKKKQTGFPGYFSAFCAFRNILWRRQVAFSSLICLFPDLEKDVEPESAGFDLHAHHGEDAAHIVCGNGALLVSEPVKAPLQHQYLDMGSPALAPAPKYREHCFIIRT